jgi:hypothetical protein
VKLFIFKVILILRETRYLNKTLTFEIEYTKKKEKKEKKKRALDLGLSCSILKINNAPFFLKSLQVIHSQEITCQRWHSGFFLKLILFIYCMNLILIYIHRLSQFCSL